MPAIRPSTLSSSSPSAVACTYWGPRPAAGMAPLITALVESIADTARRRAAASPGGRLYPPLGLFIDRGGADRSAAFAAQPPGRGQGIVTFVILQSLGQARERWGEHGATAMWDACTAKLIFDGLTSTRDLDDICKLCPRSTSPSSAGAAVGTGTGATAPRRGGCPRSRLTTFGSSPASTHCSCIQACGRWRPSSASGRGALYAGLIRQARAAMDTRLAGEHHA
jgi:hypothetical protein